MKIGLTFPINELNGAAGGPTGLVYFSSRGLNVARTNFVPANPSTAQQDAIRGMFGGSASAFKTISQSQKDAWDIFAQLMEMKIMGQNYVTNAIAQFCRINVLRQIGGESISLVAPSAKCDFAVTALADANYITEDPSFTVKITHNASVLTNKHVCCKVTSVLPSDVYVPQEGDFRLVNGVSSTSIVALGTSGAAHTFMGFDGRNYTEGDPIGVKILPLSPDFVPGQEFQDSLDVSIVEP